MVSSTPLPLEFVRQEPNNSVYLASCIGLKCNNLEHYDVYITVPMLAKLFGIY